jgi:arrestin-related trafficking adapter 4/5/7
VENIWPNKIEYSISIPNKAVAFGSFVQVDFKLISLLKGLVIGNVSTQVKEEQEFLVDPEWGVSALNSGITKTDRVVVSDVYKVSAETDEQIIDEAAEGYQFSRYLELPKSLNQCIQDCNVKGIKIRHKVKFNVQLHNPDGHISELRANLPVTFYISPSLPINENNDLVDQTPQASRAAIVNDLANAAPPMYGQHTLDTLYSDMDGYRTPGTALSTPGTPYMHSRRASHENLSSLAGDTNGNFVSPIALQSRLQDLRVQDSSIQDLSANNQDSEIQSLSLRSENRPFRSESSPPPPNLDSSYFEAHDASTSQPNSHHTPNGFDSYPGESSLSHPSSLPGSNLMSRRTSEEEDGQHSGTRTPFPQYDHMEDLARVPSYSTAVKTPLPRTLESSSSLRDLPTYGAATTIPSPPALAEPPSVHIRTSPRLPGRVMVSNQSPESPIVMPPRGSISMTNRSISSIQDDERRLRVMQMRGR